MCGQDSVRSEFRSLARHVFQAFHDGEALGAQVTFVTGAKVRHYQPFGSDPVREMTGHLRRGMTMGPGKSFHVHVGALIERQQESVGRFMDEHVAILCQRGNPRGVGGVSANDDFTALFRRLHHLLRPEQSPVGEVDCLPGLESLQEAEDLVGVAQSPFQKTGLVTFHDGPNVLCGVGEGSEGTSDGNGGASRAGQPWRSKDHFEPLNVTVTTAGPLPMATPRKGENPFRSLSRSLPGVLLTCTQSPWLVLLGHDEAYAWHRVDHGRRLHLFQEEELFVITVNFVQY